MEKNKAPMFTFTIVAIILGVTLFKQFDFENLKFENTALAIVYLVVFVFAIYVLIKNFISKKQQPTSRD
jgi:membrane protein DedA with SNARE-associated domain